MTSVQQTARAALGFELHAAQLGAVDAVVAGRDTLVVMPTGSGKSGIYHVAGLLLDGPTVDVSPLIALQRDQVDAIQDADAGDAAASNSAPEHRGAVAPSVLADETDLSETNVSTVLSRLEEIGVVEILATGEASCDGAVAESEVEAAAAGQENRRAFDRSRVEMMRGYAETRDCRRGYLLNYFGESFDRPCGNCDNCEAGIVDDGPREMPFQLGSRVRHADWGEGEVQRYDADKLVVLFDDVGYKTLAVDLVLANDLLERA